MGEGVEFLHDQGQGAMALRLAARLGGLILQAQHPTAEFVALTAVVGRVHSVAHP